MKRPWSMLSTIFQYSWRTGNITAKAVRVAPECVRVGWWVDTGFRGVPEAPGRFPRGHHKKSRARGCPPPTRTLMVATAFIRFTFRV